MMRTNQKKVVLITGCSTGLGRELALSFHRSTHPYSVIATARNPKSLSDLADQGIRTLSLDVCNASTITAAVDTIIKEEGHIDVLINNAGLSRVGPLIEQPISEMQEILETNVLGVVRVTQEVAKHMVKQRKGTIVMIGSVTSQISTPWAGVYAASKAALLSITDVLRLELHPFNIGVTYIGAGAIQSSFADNILASTDMSQYQSESSVYRSKAGMLISRAKMSQDPSHSMTAAKAAEPIVGAVSNVMFKEKKAPRLVMTGGRARVLWCTGVLQKLFGCGVNSMLIKKFELTPDQFEH